MQEEATLASTRPFSSLVLRRSFFLCRGAIRIRMEPDGGLSHVYSSRARKLLFGRCALELFKVQAGLSVPLKPREMSVKLLSNSSVEFSYTPQEQVQVIVTTGHDTGDGIGYSRRVAVYNRSGQPLRLRLLTLIDPSSLNFRRERDPPGEIGMNAFNRGDHVVMDDVGDSTGARVVGFSPRPSTIYMSRDRQRVTELLTNGELPESISGLSGPVMILAQQEAELPPRGSAEFLTVALYDDSSLQAPLQSLSTSLSRNDARVQKGDVDRRGSVRCSSSAITFAYLWAKVALYSMEGEEDLFDRLCSGVGLGLVRPDYLESDLSRIIGLQHKDGMISEEGSSDPRPAETALFLINACSYLALKRDRKLTRKHYPALRKAGLALVRTSEGGLVNSSQVRADGWRRRLGSGFPTGATSEVNLLVARALADMAELAHANGKGTEAAGFKEASVRMVSSVDRRLKDAKTGNLALNIDAKGRIHQEMTVDQAVALYYHPFDRNLASSVVHRLLEKDFESGFGPRCVPTSNPLYYHPTYGEGQLGGCWIRASLAHARLAYATGYPSIAGVQVEKVARLVHTEWERLGGFPGEFPSWFSETERRVVSGPGSDVVAAARFVEAVIMGELGLAISQRALRVEPPTASLTQWISVHDLDLGEKGSLFIGRTAGKVAMAATTYRQVQVDGSSFSDCLRLEGPLETLCFSDASSMLICVGAPDGLAQGTQRPTTISIPVTGPTFSRAFSLDIQEFNPEVGSWATVGRARGTGEVPLKVDLRPGGWRAYRLTPSIASP